MKEGDFVICVNVAGASGVHLKKYAVYLVENCTNPRSESPLIRLQGLGTKEFLSSRFVDASDFPMNVLTLNNHQA